MSSDESHPDDLGPAPTDETLTQLLTRAHQPPQMDPEARKRVLEHLKATRRSAPSTIEPTEAPKSPDATAQRMAPVVSLASWRRPTVAGVVAALVAAAVLLLFWLRPDPVLHDNISATPQKVTLADGTVLVLDAGARVRDFGDRHIELEHGRLFVDVAAHRDEFVVDTPHGSAKALGTRFLVSLDDAAMHAAVARGRVELSGRGGRELLGAGQEGRVGADQDGVVRKPAPRLSHLASWARPALEGDTVAPRDPIRRGNLIAREPRWGQEWPLPIRDLVIDVHVEGSVARTTVDQTFFNHTQRQLEGQYSFPLPSGAAISRLAMFVDGKRMESAVVERQRGRNIYEEIVHRRRDPALLEWMGGNLFRMRIFPLPARREKRLVLSYTQTLESLYGTRRLVVPIPEIDVPVGKVAYRVRVVDGASDEVVSTSHEMSRSTEGADRVLSFEAERYGLGDDLSITIRPEDAPATHVATLADEGGDYLMVRARPELPLAQSERTQRNWVVLFDTSASRSTADLAMQRELLTALMHEWDEGDHYAIVAFDASTRMLTDGFSTVTAESPAGVLRNLRESTSEGLGETNLPAALATARELLAKAPEGEAHVLYLGDGVATSEATRPKALAEALEGTKFVGIGMGDVMDVPLLRTLADETGGFAITVPRGDDLRWRAFDLVATLNTPRLLEVRAEVEGANGEPIAQATAYGPAQIAAGEDALFVARLPAGESAERVRLRGVVRGEAWSTSIPVGRAHRADTSYLPRLWAERRVAALTADEPAEHQAEITALGMQHFLVTPFTSLLVVETEQMAKDLGLTIGSGDGWAKYRLPDQIEDRYEPNTAVARIDDVPPGTVVTRRPLQLLRGAPMLGNEEIGLGSIGLIGAGFGGGGKGFGSGHGRLGGRLDALQEAAEFGMIGQLGAAGPMDFKRRGFRALEKSNKPRVRMGAAEIPAVSFDEDKRGFLADIPVASPAVVVTGKSSSTLLPSSIALSRPDEQRARRQLAWDADGFLPMSGERMPIALQYSRDQTLDDLTAFVPALATDASDFSREAAWLHAASRGKERQVAAAERDEASRRVSRAFAAQGEEAWRADDGAIVARRADGTVAIQRTTAFSLKERTVIDDDGVHTFYPELKLVVRRPLGPSRAAVLADLAGFWLPSFEEMDRCFEVAPSGESDVSLRLPLPGAEGGESQAIELTLGLDASGVLTSVTRSGLGYQHSRFERSGNELAVVDDRGRRTELTRAELGDVDFSVTTPEAWAALDMPMVEPGTWQRAATKATKGSKEHRHALQQLLAVHAAVGDVGALRDTLVEIDDEFGPPNRGELALASRVIPSGDIQAWLDDRPSDEPVVAHMLAIQKHATGTDAGEAFSKARELSGLVGTLARYRTVLAQIERREESPLRAFEAFVEQSKSPEMVYTLASQLQSRWSYEKPVEARKAWLVAAEVPALTTMAKMAEARIAQQQGEYEQAGELAREALVQALERGEHPMLDSNSRHLLNASGRDRAGLDSVWTLYRQRLLDSRDPSAWITLLASSRAMGKTTDVQAIATQVKGREVRDPFVALQLARELLAASRPGDALRTLAPLREGSQKATALWMSAHAAESMGRFDTAASFLSQAMQAGPDDVSLTDLRGQYVRLFDLHVRAAAAADRAPHAALAVAAEWRRLDPDHADIDVRCAELLYGLGRPKEAWRHLSSIIERHPAEGSAHAQVAEVLERRGNLSRALGSWQRAVDAEPTNPTWLLRQSHALRAKGDRAGATAALRKIADGDDWQPRFADVVRQAKALLPAAPPAREEREPSSAQ